MLVTLTGKLKDAYGTNSFNLFSVISSTAGNAVYYMFASYQDNNIIKEDDGIYEVNWTKIYVLKQNLAKF